MNHNQAKPRSATLIDVANLAGVSVATASRALSGRGYASEEIKERVRQAASELNYRPNASARSLKLNRTHTIGLVITDITNPFYSYLADGALDCAKQLGYHVILCATDEDPDMERDYLKVLMEQRVDGILAVSTGHNAKLWRELRALDVKLVLVDREIPGLQKTDVVMIDNPKGACLATEYLIRLGHRRIGMIGGPLTTTTGNGRYQGYCNALRAAEIPVDPDLIQLDTFKHESGFQAVNKLLTLPEPPTAIFATNNVLGETAIFGIREHGLKIPDDISFMMFDDVPWASLMTPSICVVAQPTYQMGYMGLKLLDQRLEAADSVEEPAPVKIVMEPELILRESCQAPNR